MHTKDIYLLIAYIPSTDPQHLIQLYMDFRLAATALLCSMHMSYRAHKEVSIA